MQKLELIFFIGFSALALFSAIMMITRRNPIASALYLILNYLSVSGIYLLLKAQFIAIIQVLVYMGAIMESKLEEKVSYKKLTAVLLSIFLFLLLGFTVFFGFQGKFPAMSPDAEKIGTAEFLGRELFLKYAMPVEIAGLLLLAAVVGAVVLAKKKFEN